MSIRIQERPRIALDREESIGPAWLGKRVGRFRLVAELGRGAMGRVFRAEDTLLHRQVALKVLPKFVRRGNRTIAAERLISEARAAASLDHPNIVSIYEVNESGGMYYVAMELLEGGSLKDIVRAAGPMDSARACLMCADAADGLAQAHSLGIVHRDVKPANLMLTRGGRCKVVDFGLARLDDASDLSFSLPESVGTPQFIAPELLRGVPASARSDIYSLGATLWFLLTARPPFEAATAAGLLRKHLETPLPDLAALRLDLPPGLVQALNKAMAKRPSERFESADQFQKVLRIYTIAPEPSTSGSLSDLVAETEPVVPEPSLPSPAPFKLRLPRLPRLAERQSILVGAAVAGLVLFMVLLVVILRAMHPSHTTLPDASRTEIVQADPVPLMATAPRQPPDVYPAAAAALPLEDAQMLAARGNSYARHGQFVQAAADYAKAIEIDPTDHMNWYYRACLAAYIGDVAGYRGTCKGMFQQFSASVNATVRDKTAKTCCLMEDSGVMPKDLLALADSLPDTGNSSSELAAWFNLCKGMALFRSGQYAKCIDQMVKAKTPDRLTRVSTASLFQAMAQWHRGKRSEAESLLRQATARMNDALARSGIDDLGRDGLEDWLACQAVRRQAEKLIPH